MTLEPIGDIADVSLSEVTETFIDRYEDGDISEYNDTSGQFEVSTSDPIDGTYSLRPNTSGGTRIIWSDSGLDNYPARGDTVSVLCRETSTAQNLPECLVYGEINSGSFDGYSMGVFPSNNEIRIRRMDSDSPTDLTSTSVSLSVDTIYEAVMQSTASDLTYTLYETNNDLSRGSSLASLTASDSNHSGTAIGVRNGTDVEGDGGGGWDNWKIV